MIAANRTIFDELLGIVEQKPASYPPHNIYEVPPFGDNPRRITIEVGAAGFNKEDLTITHKQNILTIRGTRNQSEDDEETIFYHRGLAKRDFSVKTAVAPEFKVTNAVFHNGILTVTLDEKQLPEDLIKIF